MHSNGMSSLTFLSQHFTPNSDVCNLGNLNVYLFPSIGFVSRKLMLYLFETLGLSQGNHITHRTGGFSGPIHQSGGLALHFAQSLNDITFSSSMFSPMNHTPVYTPDSLTQLGLEQHESRASTRYSASPQFGLRSSEISDEKCSGPGNVDLLVATPNISHEKGNGQDTEDDIPFCIIASANDGKKLVERVPGIGEDVSAFSFEADSEIRGKASYSSDRTPDKSKVRVYLRCKDKFGVFQRVLLKQSIKFPLPRRCAFLSPVRMAID